jgi:uncharacterized protein YktB (UPF0637 family)
MKLIIKDHAKKRMDLRGIDKDQIKRAIQRGSKVKQTDGLLTTHTYIQVAYKIRGEYYIIKTVKILD